MYALNWEHTRISPLTINLSQRLVPLKITFCFAVIHHLLTVSLLTTYSREFSLELKESVSLKRYKPFLNKNIRSASLYLFDRAKFGLNSLWEIHFLDSFIIILNRFFIVFSFFTEKYVNIFQ